MVKIVDDDIQQLEKDIARLEFEIERTHAVNACANLMNKYQYYHMRGMRTEETHLFALKTPGVSVEVLEGIYDEPEGVLRWKRGEGYGKPRQKGTLQMHCMTTPIIEVAKDGETAKGLWLMIGTDTWKGTDGKVSANWIAGQFAMDFIKEDGEWKIWKYITTGLICSPYEKGWHLENQDSLIQEMIGRKQLDEYKTDRPPSYTFVWGPDKYYQNIPPVPLPYETWDDSLACIPVPGKKWKIEE